MDVNSGLVKIWARLVKNGVKTIDEVPSMWNLKTLVEQRLSEDK